MAFRAERWAIGKMMKPGEVILASDPVVGVGRIGGLHLVLVATSRASYLIQGKRGVVGVLPFADLAGIGRRDASEAGHPELQFISKDGTVTTLAYDRRSKEQKTADAVTRIFFGRVIRSTARELRHDET